MCIYVQYYNISHYTIHTHTHTHTHIHTYRYVYACLNSCTIYKSFLQMYLRIYSHTHTAILTAPICNALRVRTCTHAYMYTYKFKTITSHAVQDSLVWKHKRGHMHTCILTNIDINMHKRIRDAGVCAAAQACRKRPTYTQTHIHTYRKVQVTRCKTASARQPRCGGLPSSVTRIYMARTAVRIYR
jgi:hypothetical protein